jgi:hypothetical protein
MTDIEDAAKYVNQVAFGKQTGREVLLFTVFDLREAFLAGRRSQTVDPANLTAEELHAAE